MGRAKRSKPFKGISDAEFAVLELLWKAPAGPHELREKLLAAKKGQDWAYTTVQTLLHRLLEKGFVTRERQGVMQMYSATVDRDELVGQHASDLIERLCQGAVSPLLAGLVKTRRFSKNELARFRAILDEAEGK
jgi:BlaI family penicillinase repressor